MVEDLNSRQLINLTTKVFWSSINDRTVIFLDLFQLILSIFSNVFFCTFFFTLAREDQYFPIKAFLLRVVPFRIARVAGLV